MELLGVMSRIFPILLVILIVVFVSISIKLCTTSVVASFSVYLNVHRGNRNQPTAAGRAVERGGSDIESQIPNMNLTNSTISKDVSKKKRSRRARLEKLYMAKHAAGEGRYEEMVESVEKFCNSPGQLKELTAEERELLYTIYQEAIKAPRKSWHLISSIIQMEKEKNASSGNGEHLLAIIENDISKICNSILNLLDSKLIPSASSVDSKVLYLRRKGDFLCYLVEIKTGAERKEAAETALTAYKAAQEIVNAQLSPTQPKLWLELARNLSGLYCEILKSPDTAQSLAQKAFDEAIAWRGLSVRRQHLPHATSS